MWVHAMYKYYFVNKSVAPKKATLATAKEELAITEKALAEAKARMKEVMDGLAVLEKKLQDTMNHKAKLEANMKLCEDRMGRAVRLVSGLADEKERWKSTVASLGFTISNVIGDVLISAGAVAYLTPFTDKYRRGLLKEWLVILGEVGVPHTVKCTPVSTLGEPVTIRKWQLDGLPRDFLSTENAVLMFNSTRWPLFIDPQRQANRWIRNMGKASGLAIAKLTDRDLLRSLESAVRFGKQCLIENVGTELDPALDSVLQRQVFRQAGTNVIKIGDSIVPYNEDFRLFITTKLPNPHYTPEVSIKVMVVNFALVPSSVLFWGAWPQNRRVAPSLSPIHDNGLSSIVDRRIVDYGKLAQPLYRDFVVLERRGEYTKHAYDDVNDAFKQSLQSECRVALLTHWISLDPLANLGVQVPASLAGFYCEQISIDQLLALVVMEERPDLEEARGALIVSSAQMRHELKEIEDRILYRLSVSEGSPVDDIDLINTLEASKVKSEEIKIKVEDAEKTQLDIDSTRALYIPVANRAQILFFCLSDLANIDPMYQYSLEWFVGIFINSIITTEKSGDIDSRVLSINNHFTFSLFSNVCRSLFEKHKLHFAFLLCVRILMDEGRIDSHEYHVFLAGGAPPQEKPKPDVLWLSARAWKEIQILEILPVFKEWAEAFPEQINQYQQLFDSLEPHNVPSYLCSYQVNQDHVDQCRTYRETLPSPWDERFSDFQHMIILKCLRPDKLTNAMQDFITKHLGQRFIEPQTTDLSAIFQDSSPTTPLIFVLSTGTDPASDLYKFADKMRFNKKMLVISLGQGQGPRAEAMLRSAMEAGFWVFFQLANALVVFSSTAEDGDLLRTGRSRFESRSARRQRPSHLTVGLEGPRGCGGRTETRLEGSGFFLHWPFNSRNGGFETLSWDHPYINTLSDSR
uniref:Dynein heavy chain n=1 Tax=Timema cristinae TaxID=61476 RepID=A0A7R9CFK6_TIMCR|nr:unnamed protein product [Timema cristinae]